ncbi:hypothetical protein [Azospirillum sp. Sh1]|uniref:hypothetical protein n=1 Tax=Azospirillum sp. Sh1 TaxID=2607285 RepID=UPI00165E7A35|nr:hypothetical protein [Azospirillum sp. Sh1]
MDDSSGNGGFRDCPARRQERKRLSGLLQWRRIGSFLRSKLIALAAEWFAC